MTVGRDRMVPPHRHALSGCATARITQIGCDESVSSVPPANVVPTSQ